MEPWTIDMSLTLKSPKACCDQVLTTVIGQCWHDGPLWGIKPNMLPLYPALCSQPSPSQPADGLGIHVEIFISPLTIPTFYKQLTILKIIWEQ